MVGVFLFRGAGVHGWVPPGPVDDAGVRFYLRDSGGTEYAVVVLPLPAGHASVNAIGVDAEIFKIINVEVLISFVRTDILGADTPLCSGYSDRRATSINPRRKNRCRQ